ncbi:RNA 2',3'-cyclic phosphodiesterase [Nitrospirales bacterium NOB]|nr:RNA 2',3'-cyclic phosphodiesterase [Nitrospirota bacterium]MCK6492435.1 RNA 2',3'-cyclic phosphodiesterase [Nitrospira sp.]MDL1890492.1 RNA 2',3'-cyclic phosphodiesterase [Nitrospirales bacterium NOB]MEB2339698.1 RNA 2',3'-cyclic phosphodiesterase [Nitrospirales bacterium]QOJ34089.1 MAG: RNA 2',3'-cyclic phosphodiesterase [Nitrospira sp.]
MIRTFLAVALPATIRRALSTLQQDLKQRLDPVAGRQVRLSWVRPDAMHLTLRFLGDTPEDVIDLLRLGVEEAAQGQRAVTVPLQRLGAFPRPQQPRVLWVGPSESWERGPEAQRLAALHRAVEVCCRSAGFAPEERPFSPHLTVARIKEGERQAGQALAQGAVLDRPVELGELPVDAILLMKSELRPTGSIYSTLWEVPLQ